MNEEPVIVIKRCARSSCLRLFRQLSTEPFITCPECRVPCPEYGGCTHYGGVSEKYQTASTTFYVESKQEKF